MDRNAKAALEVTVNADELRRVQRRLQAYARRKVADPVAAEDLVQETLLAAWRNRRSLRRPDGAASWMAAILRNKIADYHRRGHREIPTDVSAATSVALQVHDVPRLEARSAARAMLGRLSTLTELERRAFWLCDVEESDREEAAAALMISRSHLRVLLHRGRRRLRQEPETVKPTP
jgi:RNA polymerase sigma-70 factor (ECF subfamily)